MSARLTTLSVVVPDGVGPGESFVTLSAWGSEYSVTCPDGTGAGETVSIDIPATPEADATLLAAVQQQTDDASFMTQIEDYCRQHAHLVAERSRKCAAEETTEYSLTTQEVHRGYAELVERLLEEHIVTALGLPVEDFVGVVRRAGVDGDGAGNELLRTVESLTDFDVFCAMIDDMRFS